MFSVVNKLLGKDTSPPIFPDLEDRAATELLTTFFKEKVSTRREGLTDSEESNATDPSVFSGEVLSHFTPLTEEQLKNAISRSKITSSCVDLIPMKIIMDCQDIFIPVILLIINTTLVKDMVPKPLKCAVAIPFLKDKRTGPKCSKELLTSVKLLYSKYG